MKIYYLLKECKCFKMQIITLLSNQKDGLRKTNISFRYILNFIIYLLFYESYLFITVLQISSIFYYSFYFPIYTACLWSPVSPAWLFCRPYRVCQAPLFHGILQVRSLEWVGSDPPGDLPDSGNQTCILCLLYYSCFFFLPLAPLGEGSLFIISTYAIMLLYAFQFHYHLKGPCYSLKT